MCDMYDTYDNDILTVTLLIWMNLTCYYFMQFGSSAILGGKCVQVHNIDAGNNKSLIFLFLFGAFAGVSCDNNHYWFLFTG